MFATTGAIFTLFSKPDCVQCNATLRHFERRGLIEGRDYQVIDLTQNPEALERLRALGYAEAAVVFFANDHWSGFQPDKIDDHLLSLQPA